MTKTLRATLLVGAMTFSGTAQAAVNLLTNGSFEARVVTAGDVCMPTNEPWCVRDTASTPGWTQFADNVDLINNNVIPLYPNHILYASDGVNFLDMNSCCSNVGDNKNGGVFQIVSATAGTIYNLSLDTGAWATNAITSEIMYELYDPTSNAVLASGTYKDNTGGSWINRTLSATATSNSIGVRIQNIYSYQAAMGLDNVILTAVPVNGVPEPATWAMMLAGFGFVGGALRRRAKVAVTYA